MATDNLDIIGTGGIGHSTGQNGREFNAETPEELLHSGDHHNDTTEAQCCQFSGCGMEAGELLPHTKLLDMVEKGGFKRKTPKFLN